MRYHRSAIIPVLGLGLAVTASLTGCAMPRHSDTLLFGTNTKIALDISGDPSGRPEITVGYRRQELVWMPLVVNGEHATSFIKNTGYVGPAKYWGQDKDNAFDTYSVLASFGAKFSAEASTSAKAEGGLAQYFATGLAARKLAEVGGARLVSIQPGESASEEIKEAAKKQLAREYTDIERILTYVNREGNVEEERLKQLIPGTGLDEQWVKKFSGKPVKDLRKELDVPSRRVVPRLAANIKEEGG